MHFSDVSGLRKGQSSKFLFMVTPKKVEMETLKHK